MLNTHLSQRGYAIEKKGNEELVEKLKAELTVKPNTMSMMGETATTFPVYRENDKKLYLPKYYGLNKFGAPTKLQLHDGVDCPNLEFQGEIRDLQKPAVQAFLQACEDPKKMGGLLSLPCGFGKCLGINTPVIMYNGKIKMVQTIMPGDKLMGDDSKSRNVLSICRGREQMYRIVPEKCDAYVVNESHILSLMNIYTFKRVDLTVLEYLAMDVTIRALLCGYHVAIQYDYIAYINKSALVYRYLQTCAQRDGEYVARNEDFSTDMIFLLRSLGYMVYYNNAVTGGRAGEWIIEKHPHSIQVDPITVEKLEIDDYYGFEIDGNRRFLLGDFTVTHNTVVALNLATVFKKKTLIVCHTNFLMDQWIERIQQYIPKAAIGRIKQKLCDVQDKDIVIASLQSLAMRDYDADMFKTFGYAVFDECFPYDQPILTKQGFLPIGELFSEWRNGYETPLVMSYNLGTQKFEWKKLTHAWKKEYHDRLIRIIFKDPYGAPHTIECTPNHRLLTASQEWKEASELRVGDNMIGCVNSMSVDYIEYIEAAGVQGQHVYDIEVEDNHNFICNYIVAHNCHHLGAEVFSRCLPLVTCRRMLGLSATLKRKDGLSKVFEWHLGKPVYTIKRQDSEVLIKVVTFYDPNPAYSMEHSLWGGGAGYGKKLNVAKMINQVCDYAPRNHKMIQVLKEVLVAEPNRKVLILSERRGHLQELENLLRIEGYASIGYYVGGMKKEQLEKGAAEDIILATFQLASEAMDIPKLNTLVLGSPVSSIEQPIGRIQRKKKEDREYTPLVIDFLDEFSVFQGQGKKRMAFYKKNGYDTGEDAEKAKKEKAPRKYNFIRDEEE